MFVFFRPPHDTALTVVAMGVRNPDCSPRWNQSLKRPAILGVGVTRLPSAMNPKTASRAGVQIQKASAQIEASKPAPQVLNNPSELRFVGLARVFVRFDHVARRIANVNHGIM